ncbi:MAG: AAA family ATPase [Leptolyngbya sp. SIO3F4]|nr:AAA family ATPase [Leptolyngbya sp. SIO3F4]
MSIPSENFAKAAQNWRLELLYKDLDVAKGNELTSTEAKYLRGLLCGYSPGKIAEKCHVEPDTVRQCLSKHVYRYIENLVATQLLEQANQTAQVKNWRWVPRLLEQTGYRLQQEIEVAEPRQPLVAVSTNLLPNAHESWDSQPDISVFYDRTHEITLLKQWALTDRCRTIVLYGLGGIGKTSLAAKLAHTIKDEFECLIWRSLRNQPAVQPFLLDILDFLNYLSVGQSLQTPSDYISQLLRYLQEHRCLLVFDDVQAILSSGELSGKYQAGFESYGELLRRLEEETHQSCAIFTSWEKLREASKLSGPSMPVRSYRIEGLGDEAKAILAHEQLLDEARWHELVAAYGGNPLALRIIASTIQELFGGSVAEFLDQNTLFLGDFRYLLHQQFKRLSSIEQDVMTCLAHQGHPLTLPEILTGITSEIRRSELMAVLNSLGRRSLLENAKRGDTTIFMLQPTIEKYVKYHASK